MLDVRSFCPKSIQCFILCFAFVFLLVVWLPSSHAEELINAVCDYNYPPFQFADNATRPRGYDVELLTLIADEMNFQLKTQCLRWLEAQQQVLSEKADLISGMTYTEPRSVLFDFSKPTLKISFVLFLRKENSGLERLDQLEGSRIAVQKGGVAEFLVAKYPNINPVILDDTINGIEALKERSVLAFLGNKVVGEYLIKKHEIKDIVQSDASVYVQDYGIAVKKGNTELLELLNEGIQRLEQKGAIKALQEKWLSQNKESGYGKKYFNKVQLLILICFLTLVLLSNLNLRKELKEQKRFVLQKNEQIVSLYSLSLTTSYTLSMEDILKLFTEHLKRSVRYEKQAIILKNQIDERHYTSSGASFSDDSVQKLTEALQDNSLITEPSPIVSIWSDKVSNQVLSEVIQTENLEVLGILALETIEMKFGYVLIGFGKDGVAKETRRMLEHIVSRVSVALLNAWLYQEMQSKNKELEAKNKELEAYVYTVSHDLKTPLISLKGYADLLRLELVDVGGYEVGKILLQIDRNLRHMYDLIDSLLDISQLSRLRNNIVTIDMNRVVHEALRLYELDLVSKNLEVTIKQKLPIIKGDFQRIKVVLENLLANAIYYTPPEKKNAKITIDYIKHNYEHEFSVSDEGIGIERRYHDKIFEIFHRLKEMREVEGTGVGLTVAKTIVEGHGGRIWLESEPGVGSTFYFTISKDPPE